ncbi:MAG: hypothetical protein JXX28_15570 [Deltaproteobacteria bacterium]|nr:hypothetical protein [Deltaproteobacteria bacterium]
MFVREGSLVYVQSNITRHHLGTILIREFGVPEEAIEELRLRERQTGAKPGKLLASGRYVASAQLKVALRRQYEEVLFDLMHIDGGTYDIDPDGTIVQKGVIVFRYPISKLQASLQQRVWAFSQLRAEAGDLEIVPNQQEPESQAGHKIVDTEILSFRAIDGSRNIEQILHMASLPMDACLANLLSLRRKALVRFGEDRTPKPAAKREAPVQMVAESVLETLQEAMVRYVGPMAEFALDEAIEELGAEWNSIPTSRLDELIELVSEQIPSPPDRARFLAGIKNTLKR